MLLSENRIRELNLLEGVIPKNYSDASASLTVARIISNNQEIKEGSYFIPPQGMVLAVSNERFNLKGKNVIGYTTVVNKLSMTGVWALNIGIVDSNWDQQISSVLINFGKQPYELCIGDAFLRMTFHSYNNQPPAAINQLNEETVNELKEKYIRARKFTYRTNMDEKFLRLGQLEGEITTNVKNKILEQARLLAGILAFASIILSIVVFITSNLFKEKSDRYYESKLMSSQHDKYSQRLDSLDREIHDLKIQRDSLRDAKTDTTHR